MTPAQNPNNEESEHEKKNLTFDVFRSFYLVEAYNVNVTESGVFVYASQYCYGFQRGLERPKEAQLPSHFLKL